MIVHVTVCVVHFHDCMCTNMIVHVHVQCTCMCMCCVCWQMVQVNVPLSPLQKLPCMNNLQTELKIFFEDSSTGQYSSAYRLAVVPDMTVAEVCDVIAKKHYKTNPASYGLFTVIDGRGQ